MWIFSYWLLPFLSAVVWLAMLLTMLIYWLARGRQMYPTMAAGQDVAFISDVGAFNLKPLFIAGSCIVTVLLDAAFLSERWLRHRGRLAKNTGKAEKIVVALSLVFALLGTIGLILLSIFDTYRYVSLHRLFLLFFLGGYVLSAICICIEYQRLGSRFKKFRVLRLSFWIKLVFIIVELGLSVGFISCLYTGRVDTSATLEWVVAFIFTFYILVFVIDLLPATRKKHHHMMDQGTTEMGLAGTKSQAGHTTHGVRGNDMSMSESEAGYSHDRPWPPAVALDGAQPNGYSYAATPGQPSRPIPAQNF